MADAMGWRKILETVLLSKTRVKVNEAFDGDDLFPVSFIQKGWANK